MKTDGETCQLKQFNAVCCWIFIKCSFDRCQYAGYLYSSNDDDDDDDHDHDDHDNDDDKGDV